MSSRECLWLVTLLALLTRTGYASGASGCPTLFGAFHQIASLSVEGCQVRFLRSKAELTAEKGKCSEPMPPMPLTMKELLGLRPKYLDSVAEGYSLPEGLDQRPVSCVREGPELYFGVAFYSGEGITGAGGIGRLDLGTQKLEVRRPKPLLDHSARKLLVIEESLWLATENFNEGTRGPGIGLLRYDWAEDQVETFQGAREGPCGLWINDLLVHEGELWVATELGISRYSLAKRTWRHFIPRDETSQELRETSCREVYQEVASQLPENLSAVDACDLDGKSARDMFRVLLNEHRPADAESIDWAR